MPNWPLLWEIRANFGHHHPAGLALPENQHGLKPPARSALCGVQGVFGKGPQKASSISGRLAGLMDDGLLREMLEQPVEAKMHVGSRNASFRSVIRTCS